MDTKKKKPETPIYNKTFKEEFIMKNFNNYILTAIVSLILVVATSFLMTAADEPIRQAGYYLPVVFGAVAAWAAGKAGLLELDYEERTARRSAHTAA